MSVFVSGKWKEYLSALKIWQAVWWREWTPLPDWYHPCLTKMFRVFPHFSSFGLIYARSCQNISLEYDWNYKNRSLGSYLGCCQDIFKIRNIPNPDQAREMDLFIFKVVNRTRSKLWSSKPSACYRQLTTKCVSENRQKPSSTVVSFQKYH